MTVLFCGRIADRRNFRMEKFGSQLITARRSSVVGTAGCLHWESRAPRILTVLGSGRRIKRHDQKQPGGARVYFISHVLIVVPHEEKSRGSKNLNKSHAQGWRCACGAGLPAWLAPRGIPSLLALSILGHEPRNGPTTTVCALPTNH